MKRKELPSAGPTIVDALDDEALFASLFRGTSWDRWRILLKATFGLPLDGRELALYQHHTGRQHAPEQQVREVVLAIGRRGGKSRVLAALGVWLATFRDYRPYTAPGEIPTVGVIASDRKQAKVILSYAAGLLRNVDLLAELIEKDDSECIELSNGVVIEVTTGNYASPRGKTYVCLLCDEIAFWRTSDNSRNPDTEIITAARPGLATIPNSILLMASSVYAKRGVLWNSFKRNFGRDDSKTLVWRGTSLEMNSQLDPAVVEAAYDEDPVSAAAEYDSQFRDDIAAYISRETVDACVIVGRDQLPPASSGIAYSCFIDPSGGSRDSMTLAIGHAANGIGILDKLVEVKPPFDPTSVAVQFAEEMQRYGINKAQSDRYGGDWVSSRFREAGVTVEPAERTKSDYYREFLPLLNSGKVELLDNPRLANQLVALERRTARGGKDSVDHPPGGHDDVANAAAAVLVNVAGKPSSIDVWLRCIGLDPSKYNNQGASAVIPEIAG